MSTTDKLNAIIANNEAIIESRDDIAIAIANKGVVVPSSTKLNGMATLIESIEVGGFDGEIAVSEYYLNICMLTIDDGYHVARIPISAGNVIDLGDGEDVAASTNWGSHYHANSHPAMTFQEWASSIEITDNQFVVPDDICTDYHVGAIYVTADGLNHYIEYGQAVGFSHRSDSLSEVVEGGSTAANANQSLVACWLGDNVSSIGDEAFRLCLSLSQINIPLSVVSIGESAFRNCSMLKWINLPSNVTNVGDYAIYYCDSITSISIPNGVVNIGDFTFRSCYAASVVSTSRNTTHINESAFFYCRSLAAVNLADEVVDIGDFAFNHCRSIAAVTLSEGLTHIGVSAFGDCVALPSINIPSNVTHIGSLAFSGCSGLISVVLNSDYPPILPGPSVFDGCPATFLVPKDRVLVYKAYTNWSALADRIIANTNENRLKFGLTLIDSGDEDDDAVVVSISTQYDFDNMIASDDWLGATRVVFDNNIQVNYAESTSLIIPPTVTEIYGNGATLHLTNTNGYGGLKYEERSDDTFIANLKIVGEFEVTYNMASQNYQPVKAFSNIGTLSQCVVGLSANDSAGTLEVEIDGFCNCGVLHNCAANTQVDHTSDVAQVSGSCNLRGFVDCDTMYDCDAMAKADIVTEHSFANYEDLQVGCYGFFNCGELNGCEGKGLSEFADNGEYTGADYPTLVGYGYYNCDTMNDCTGEGTDGLTN